MKKKITLRDIGKVLLVILVIALVIASQAGSFYLGHDYAKKEAELTYENKKIEEERQKSLEAFEKGTTLGEDKLKETGSIGENIALAKQLSIYAELISKSDIASKLEEVGPYTIFVYQDEIIAQLGEEKLNSLRNDKNLLNDFLLHHIIFGEVNSNALVNASQFQASNGKTIRVKKVDGTISINGANVLIKDIKSRNGIIHILQSPMPI